MQVFDVITFDMIAMLRLSFVPSCAAFIYKVSFDSLDLTFLALCLPLSQMWCSGSTRNPESSPVLRCLRLLYNFIIRMSIAFTGSMYEVFCWHPTRYSQLLL